MTAQHAHHSAAGEGEELAVPDATVTVKVGARHTDGDYEVFEIDAPRGPASPLHRTPWSKAYYAVTGRILVQVEDEGYDLAPGASITVPPNALHTFTVLTPAARFIAISLTGRMGEFFGDLARTVPPGRPATEIAPLLGDVAARHGITVVESSR